MAANHLLATLPSCPRLQVRCALPPAGGCGMALLPTSQAGGRPPLRCSCRAVVKLQQLAMKLHRRSRAPRVYLGRRAAERAPMISWIPPCTLVNAAPAGGGRRSCLPQVHACGATCRGLAAVAVERGAPPRPAQPAGAQVGLAGSWFSGNCDWLAVVAGLLHWLLSVVCLQGGCTAGCGSSANWVG